MPKDQPAVEERRDVRPKLTEEQIAKQQAELAEAYRPAEAPEAPKGREPGSHPLVPISSDAQAAADLFFLKPEDVAEASGQKAVYDTTAYGAVVVHRF